MRRISLRSICLILAGSVFATFQTGCVSGGWGLTRSVAHWTNSFSPVFRVLIYIGLWILPVWELSILFDVVLNNTFEFWGANALISAQHKVFEKDGYKIVVDHSRNPLRKSVFTVFEKSGAVKSVSELRETSAGTVDVYLNGVKTAELKSLSEGLTQVSRFAADGTNTIEWLSNPLKNGLDTSRIANAN